MKKALILSGICWNDTFQRHQQFATYLSQIGFEVFFVERIMSSKFSVSKVLSTLQRKIARKTIDNQKKVNPLPKNVKIINCGFVNPEPGIFKRINLYKIEKLIKELGTEFDLVINYLPVNTTEMIIDRVKYRKLIYDCVRNFEGWGGYRNTIVEDELRLIDRSDMIFTDSFFLTDKMLLHKKDVVQFLPIANTLWISGCRKKKVSEIKKIAYFGTIGTHIDVDVLHSLVTNNYELHFWGASDITIKCNYINHGYVGDLKVLAEEITSTCDAIVLPYTGNMDGVIPAKMLQCLSTELPVYISEFYDSKKMDDYVYLFKDTCDLINKIKNFDKEKHIAKTMKTRQLIEEITESKQIEQFRHWVLQ